MILGSSWYSPSASSSYSSSDSSTGSGSTVLCAAEGLLPGLFSSCSGFISGDISLLLFTRSLLSCHESAYGQLVWESHYSRSSPSLSSGIVRYGQSRLIFFGVAVFL